MNDSTERPEQAKGDRDLLERFKRHFMLVRKARKALGEAQLSWKMSFDPSNVESKVAVPDGMPTFSALIRPLLDPESEMSLRKVWQHLREDERLSLTEEDVASVEHAFAAAGKGGMKLVWNDREVSGWEMYDRVAKGAYFDEQQAHARFLEALKGHPARDLLWFSFWAFQDDSYRLASWLFEQASALSSADALNGEAPVSSSGCLFCRQRDGGFSSEEHIFPESLIGDADRLPKGLVCDRCNHGPLSQLDEASSASGRWLCSGSSSFHSPRRGSSRRLMSAVSASRRSSLVCSGLKARVTGRSCWMSRRGRMARSDSIYEPRWPRWTGSLSAAPSRRSLSS